MGYTARASEFVQVTCETLAAELEPFAGNRARGIAFEIARQLIARFAGQHVYIPHGCDIARAARDRAMVMAWRSGRFQTFQDLGAEFGVSGAHAARIIRHYTPAATE